MRLNWHQRRRSTTIDDPMFTPGQEPGPGGDPAGKPNGGDPKGAEPVTLEVAAELVTQALAPLTARLEEMGVSQAQIVEKLAQGPPQGNQDPALTPEAEDFLTQFGTDPEKALKAVVRGEMGTLAPLIGNLMNSGASAFVGLEAQQIDQEFGSGAWEKLFEKPMGVIVDSYRKNNPVALSDRNTIGNEVNGLKGKLFNELVTHREESRKSAADTKESTDKELREGLVSDVIQRTNLTGGIRRIEGSGEEVTEDLKSYLNERTAAIGGNTDPKTWLEDTDFGSSLEEFQAHQAALAAKREGN